jgi:hypothetical protein
MHLMRNAFIGFGIAFIKSLSTFRSVGFRVAIPFTQNFVEYDNRIYLPRIVVQAGAFYPEEIRYVYIKPIEVSMYVIHIYVYIYRMSVVFSVPLHIAMYGVSKTLEGILTTHDISQRIRKRKATNAIQRVGVSVSVGYRMHSINKLVFAIGPWMFYLPGAIFFQKIFSIPHLIRSFILAIMLSLKNHSSTHVTQTHTIHKKKVDASSDRSEARIRAAILKYFYSKSPGLGYNFGWTHTNFADTIGSTLLFEMQPFYPLYRQLAFIQARYVRWKQQQYIGKHKGEVNSVASKASSIGYTRPSTLQVVGS